MIERFSAEITRRCVFEGVDELKQAILDVLDKHNGQLKLYVWTTRVPIDIVKWG
jgi:hypothetical protein